MIPHDQLADQPVDTSANQQWQQLVEKFQAAWNVGDSERAQILFTDLVDMSMPLLLTIARAKAPAEMAEDIVAEAYIEFYEMLAAHTPIRNAKALLCRIVRLRGIDEYRRRCREAKEVIQVDDTVWDGLRELPDVLTDTPEETIVLHDTARFTSNQILDGLSHEERQVLIMRHALEMSVVETAARLHMTEDQVKKRTGRAIKNALRVAQEKGLLYDHS